MESEMRPRACRMTCMYALVESFWFAEVARRYPDVTRQAADQPICVSVLVGASAKSTCQGEGRLRRSCVTSIGKPAG
jgi:hypothetical protein